MEKNHLETTADKTQVFSSLLFLRWSSVTSLYLRQGAGDTLKTKRPFNNRSAGRKTVYLSLRVFSQKWQFRIRLGIKKLMQDQIFS